MVVGIDASRPNEIKKTGTEWYAYYIIQELKKLDRKNCYLLYSIDPLRDGLEDLPANFRSRVLRSVSDILWTQFRLSLEMMVNPPDLLFVPAHNIPIIHPKITVLTVHDLGFDWYPELYKRTPVGPPNPLARSGLEVGARLATLGRYGNSEYDYQRWSMKFGVKAASHIISVSQFTKDDLVEKYGVDPNKISVVHHGVEHILYRPLKTGEKTHFKSILDLSPYILFVSRIEKKKNVANLVEAYRRLRTHKEIREKLVLIGKPGLGYEEILAQIKTSPPHIRRDIHFLGWRPEEETVEFYRHARLFAFPSNFEGFGIPVAQAMAVGVPVVTSNTTALPEVAGKAALLVDPSDPDDIAAAMYQVLTDQPLREKMIVKGIKQASKFTWKNAAEKTLAVLEETYARRHRS